MEQLWEFFNRLLGLELEARHLSFFQVSLRGVLVFLASLVMVRLADKRFFAKKSAFDIILGFILASMLARAVNGGGPFFSSIGGGFVLVGLHRVLGMLAFHSHVFGRLIKGTADKLIEDGRPVEENLRRNHMSEHDLREDLRLSGKVTQVDQVGEAWIERNGRVSVLPRQ